MFKNNFKNNILAIILSAILVFIVSGVKKSESQSFLPIGGPIIATYYCCNGIMLTLGAPKPGTYMYYWGTPLHAFYNVYEPGPYVLGRGIPGGICLISTAFPPCFYVAPTLGTFTMVGTSGL